jgi:hypothetical protein
MRTTALARNTATPAQNDYVKNLLARLDAVNARLDASQRDGLGLREEFRGVWMRGNFSRQFASQTIAELLALVSSLEGKVAKPAVAISIPDGRYAVRTDVEDEHYAFYRVWNGDRATLVFLMVSDNEMRVSRDMARTILAKIDAVGSLEAAKAYGREIGVCGVCNRTLTNPDSISAGIGPVCAGKF